MRSGQVWSVRRFNRTVTERVGALNDSYLSRDRPLGQARVLWEIGSDGADVAELRARLELDSGYLSRLLRALEAEGLVDGRTSPHDGRGRRVELTETGRAEWTMLDERSDELAASIPTPLSPHQRERLVDAMDTVERLLMASMVQVGVVPPSDPRARFCMRAYVDELSRRFDDGFDPAKSISAADEELTPPAGLFLVGTLHSEPVACGGIKFHGKDPAEIKRMWVASSVRGLGLGRRLLAELEARARRRRVRTVRLETNRSLTQAIAMYRNSGYREVPAFNDEPYAHHWFEKDLRG